jgi:hypothetical protein
MKTLKSGLAIATAAIAVAAPAAYACDGTGENDTSGTQAQQTQFRSGHCGRHHRWHHGCASRFQQSRDDDGWGGDDGGNDS